MIYSINCINREFRKFRSNLLFLFKQYYYNVKQQYQQFLILIFNMTTRGILNFTYYQKVSIGTLFCQGVNTKTFSFTKEALYTGYKTYMAIS